MAKLDPNVQAHLEWLGFVQPVEREGAGKPPPPGLVVAPTALLRASAVLPRSDVDGQRALQQCVEQHALEPGADPEPVIADFEAFARHVLDWSFSPKGYAGTNGTPLPEELTVALPDLGETLAPDLAVRELNPASGAPPWQLLVRVLDPGESLDEVERGGGQLEASAHGRMERLLRETGVTAGLLSNGFALRLISAPAARARAGWSSAWRT